MSRTRPIHTLTNTDLAALDAGQLRQHLQDSIIVGRPQTYLIAVAEFITDQLDMDRTRAPYLIEQEKVEMAAAGAVWGDM
jgi:hypothetical protein